jgi:hypothetical protein
LRRNSGVLVLERDWLDEKGELTERMGASPWGTAPLEPSTTRQEGDRR